MARTEIPYSREDGGHGIPKWQINYLKDLLMIIRELSVPNRAIGTIVRFAMWIVNCQGQVSAEGILHLVNPNVGPNSGMRIFEPRILGPNSGVEFIGPMFSNKKSPLKNSPSRNSPPKIHI